VLFAFGKLYYTIHTTHIYIAKNKETLSKLKKNFVAIDGKQKTVRSVGSYGFLFLIF